MKMFRTKQRELHDAAVFQSVTVIVWLCVCVCVSTFLFLCSWVLVLCWADCRIISPVIVCEGPGAGGGQGAGPLTSLLERDTVQPRAWTSHRVQGRPSARGGGGSGDGSHSYTVHGSVFVRVATRGRSVLAVLALISALFICITVRVHGHDGVTLGNGSNYLTCNRSNWVL